MKKIETDCLIIGAGVTGLMMAKCLKSDYLIVEKEKKLGGGCRTIKRNGFIWDYAGHFFHFRKKEMKDFFLSKIENCNIVKRRKNTKIYYRGKLINYPFQKNIHELDKNEFVECLYDLFFRNEKDQYIDFKDMLYGKYGKAITEKFLKPYNEKLYACELDSLDTDAMGRFFPDSTISDIIGNMKENKAASYNDEFLYPKGGAESFVKSLSDDLDSNSIYLNHELVEIKIKEKVAIIKGENESFSIQYEKLVNTIPYNQFLFSLGNEYKPLAKKLSFNKVLVFNIGFDKEPVYYKDYHWIYFPEKELNFYRVGFYNNILGMNQMSIYVEIGFSQDSHINIDEEFGKTIENLKKVGIVVDHAVIDYEALIMNPAYVHVNSLHDLEIRDTMSQLSDNDIYSIGRYGGWKYCSIEDSMLEAIDLFQKIGRA